MLAVIAHFDQIDDPLHTVGSPSQLLGLGASFLLRYTSLERHHALVGVDVDVERVDVAVRRELRLHRGRDGGVVDLGPRRSRRAAGTQYQGQYQHQADDRHTQQPVVTVHGILLTVVLLSLESVAQIHAYRVALKQNLCHSPPDPGTTVSRRTTWEYTTSRLAPQGGRNLTAPYRSPATLPGRC